MKSLRSVSARSNELIFWQEGPKEIEHGLQLLARLIVRGESDCTGAQTSEVFEVHLQPKEDSYERGKPI